MKIARRYLDRLQMDGWQVDADRQIYGWQMMDDR